MHVCINSKCVTDIRLVVLPADCLGYILLCFASPGISRQVRLNTTVQRFSIGNAHTKINMFTIPIGKVTVTTYEMSPFRSQAARLRVPNMRPPKSSKTPIWFQTAILQRIGIRWLACRIAKQLD